MFLANYQLFLTAFYNCDKRSLGLEQSHLRVKVPLTQSLSVGEQRFFSGFCFCSKETSTAAKVMFEVENDVIFILYYSE